MKLQLLLHPHQRNHEGLALTKQVSQSLGIRPTAEGAATISAEVDPDQFQSLFGTPTPEATATSAPEVNLPIPEPLKDYVQSISIPPRHIYMNPPKQEAG